MSQNGYQKFFKEAMKNSASVNQGPPRNQQKFVTAEQLDQFVSQKTPSQKNRQVPVESPRPSAKKKNNSTSRGMITLSLIGFVAVLGAMYFDEELEKKLSRIEVEFFGLTSAQAEDKNAAEKPVPTSKDSAASKKDTKDTDGKKATDENDDASDSSEKAVSSAANESDHFLTLAQRKKELDQRDEDIKVLEAHVLEQKNELDKKIAELEETRRKIASVLEERVKVDEQKIETLVQMYSNMRAPQAAKIFETMDEGLVVEILGRMKKKNAADVMNLIKPEKAQVFSEKLAGYRTNK
jgi:flagellar motility protein MotE (MotC chaperone)